MENELDYIKLEGNIGSDDLIKKKLLSERSSQTLCRKIKEGATFKYLEISNIKIKDSTKASFFRPSSRREIPNGNGPALTELLEAIAVSHTTLKSMEVLSFQNVQLDDKIVNAIGLIIQSNFLKELLINGCNLGGPENFFLIQRLSNALSFNTSLRGIELNSNDLQDDQGCILLQAIL